MYVTSSGVLTVDKTPNIEDMKNKQNVQNFNRTLSDYPSKFLKYYMYFLFIWYNYTKQVTNKNKRARHIHPCVILNEVVWYYEFHVLTSKMVVERPDFHIDNAVFATY